MYVIHNNVYSFWFTTKLSCKNELQIKNCFTCLFFVNLGDPSLFGSSLPHFVTADESKQFACDCGDPLISRMACAHRSNEPPVCHESTFYGELQSYDFAKFQTTFQFPTYVCENTLFCSQSSMTDSLVGKVSSHAFIFRMVLIPEPLTTRPITTTTTTEQPTTTTAESTTTREQVVQRRQPVFRQFQRGPVTTRRPPRREFLFRNRSPNANGPPSQRQRMFKLEVGLAQWPVRCSLWSAPDWPGWLLLVNKC